MKLRNIAMVGAGALGVMLGDYCVKALGKEAVCFVADPDRVARYRQDGIYCNGVRCPFSYSDKRAGEVADLLIFAVKSTGLEEALELAAPFVGPGTILMSLLNGVTSEENIGARFGREKVIPTVAQGMDARRSGNQVMYTMPGQVLIGISKDEPEKQEKLEALDRFLTGIGYPHTVEANILHKMWGKLILNVGVNQACTVFETNYGGVQKPGKAREVMVAAMEEARRVAAKKGIAITVKEMEDYVALMDSLTPEGMPSMRQDALAGRKTEVELFSGTIRNYGKSLGVPTPVNEWLYGKIKEMEEVYALKQVGNEVDTLLSD